MDIVINFTARGKAKSIYTEDIDLSILGKKKIRRASHVEPNEEGMWTADMKPSGGPILGPYEKRSEALRAEVEWLGHNL